MTITAENLENLLQKNSNLKFETVFSKIRMYDNYEKYIDNIKDKKVFFGFDTIDKTMGGLRPSELLTVIAGTNIGKSAFAMNIMYNITKKSDGLIILFSLEMSEIDIFERYVQMEFDYTTFDVENIFIKKDIASKKQILERIDKHKNIIAIIKRISIHEIIPYVKTIEQIEEKECIFVIVDHLGLVINQNFKDEYSRTTDTMMKMKELALHLKVPVMLLSQTSRADIKSKEGLTLHSGKHSGEIENSSQIVMTLQRQKEVDPNNFDTTTLNMVNKREIDLLKLTTEKKKRGDYKDVDLIFNKRNLRITEYVKC